MGFENHSALSDIVDHNNWNQSNETHIENIHAHSAEGGVLNGHGPLDSALARFLVQAVIIIGLSRFLHIFLRKLRQPRVIAEIVAGVCLGPSVFGNIPGFTDAIFKEESLAFLSTVSNIGLVFYLFLVGLELEPSAFFNEIKRSAAISIAGIVVPFGVGAACSWGLYKYLLVPNVYHIPYTSFMLFTGVAMSITAFPVLARILTEKKLLHTPVGLIAITAAAIDDAMAWTLLALVISILNAGDNLTALYVFLLALGYALLLLLGVRPLLGRLSNRFLANSTNPVSQFLVAAVFICIFTSAWITELIGVHAIFGAFLFGLAIPRSHNMAIRLTEKIEDVIIIGFLPLFFTSSGLKTNIGLLNDGMTWAWLFVVVAVACFGKLFGCSVAARLSGVPWRESASVGLLMNTRGLVQLIVLNIGHDAKVINDKIFLIMVIMALVTTFMTSPIISWIYPPKYHVSLTGKRQRGLSLVVPPSVDLAIKKLSSDREQIRVLVCIDESYQIPPIAKLLWLFKSDETSEDLIINTLKIVETNERSSTVMIASHIAQAVKTDPALNTMTLFGTIINVPTRSFMAMSPASDISDEVIYIADREECNLIVVPWYDQQVVGTILSSSPQEKIKRIVTTALATTTVYVPRLVNGASAPDIARNILVPYYGGMDGCEAIKIAMRFYRRSNIKITVLKVDYNADNLHGNLSLKMTLATVKHAFISNGLHIVRPVGDDKDLIEEIQKVASVSDGKLTFKTLETKELIKCIVDECRSNQYDLVIVGRNFKTSNEHHFYQNSFRSIPAKMSEMKNPRKVENGDSTFVTTSFQRSLSDSFDVSKSALQRSLSQEPATDKTDNSNQIASNVTRPTIVTEILGKLGQTLYEMDLSSVLVVHRNV